MSFIVTLLSAPQEVSLDGSSVNSLLSHWKGRDRVWLHYGSAVEFTIKQFPDDYNQIKEEHHQKHIDLAITPNHHRHKKLLLADMDSTIIEQECLDELANQVGIGEYVAQITHRAMNGEIPFEEALHQRVALLKDLPLSEIEETWENSITFTSGARVLIATLRSFGCYCVLVSGGFTEFTERVANSLGFHENYANVLISEGKRLTGRVKRPVLDKEVKSKLLINLATKYGLTINQTLAVGDGANDLGMINAAGLGVSFRAKPMVEKSTKVNIRHADLTSLLYLQGIKYDQFVTP